MPTPASSGPGNLTPARFVAKWSRVQLPERAASQEHFIDLCRMLGQPTPAEHDADGSEYAFEKGRDYFRKHLIFVDITLSRLTSP